MAISIRPLAASDRAEWENLWRKYLQFYETTLPTEQYDISWRRLLDPAEPMHGHVAFENDVMVGLVHLIFHRSTWLTDVTRYLQDLFVDESQRGKGTGEALIDAAADLARQNNAGRLYWLTHHSNATARRLYDRVADRSGFIQYRKPL